MVKQWLAALLSAGVLAGTLGGVSMTAAAETTDTPMDLKLWYTSPALDDNGNSDWNDGDTKEDWQKEGLPLGNGTLGAMVYGGWSRADGTSGVGRDRILINEKSVWSGGPGVTAKRDGSTQYDGGIENDYTSEEMKANLQELRQKLQDIVSDFSENKAAYVDENGNVVTNDYGSRKGIDEIIDVVRAQSVDGVWEEPELQELIMKLRGEKDYFGSYQMLSDVVIEETAEAKELEYTDYKRWLDLRTAVSGASYVKDGVTYETQYFVNNPSNVMVVRLTASEAGALTRTIAVQTDQPSKTFTLTDDTITMVGRSSDQGRFGLQLAQQVKVIADDGATVKATGNANKPVITVSGASEVVIILSAGTNYQQCMTDEFDYFNDEDPLDAVSARLDAAVEKGFEALLEEHVTDHDSLFGRVEFALDGVTMPTDKTTLQLLQGYQAGTLTDAECRYLELLYYQYGRYLLIASSREANEDQEYTLPANLQGIWADHLDPPWGADYHTNINIQMNYWLAEQTNLTECHTPMLEYTKSLVARGEDVAQYYYCTQEGGDVRGWTIGHENNLWGNTAPGVWYWGYYFPAGAAWMCQHLWEHYNFTMDKEFLADNFDIMLSAALFWVDNLWTDERDGTLVANPSYSPEHGPYSLGASCDQEIIWELFNSVLQSADILGITDEAKLAEIAEVQASMDKLYLPKIGLSGKYLEWKDETTLDVTGDGGHRHANHLFSLHPGSLVVAGRSEEDDKAVEAMKSVLLTRGDGGTGWSKAWKINFWARLRDGDHAQTMVSELLKQSTLNNLFDTHPPFQIDGNLGATAGMTEMLLQSQGDSIDLLAAMPNVWGVGGSVKGLKARGNFEIDMAWSEQQLTSATVKAVVGGDCTLNYHSLSKAKVIRESDGAEVAFTADDANTITFATEAGETYTLTEIPQDKKFAKQTTLLRTSFNNLYTEAIQTSTGCPDYNGAYVESFEAQSAGVKIGLVQNDVIRAFNGEAVNDTDDLRTMYDAAAYGDEITLTVWRVDKTIELTFTKMQPMEKYGDIYFGLPGKLYAAGYYGTLAEGAVAVTADSLTCVKGPGLANYWNIIFNKAPTAIQAEVKVNGTGTIELRHGDASGDTVATFALTDTAGAFATVSAQMKNGALLSGEQDVCVVITGDVTLRWLNFESNALLGDVDGNAKVNTTDARLTLQYAAGRIDEGKLIVAAADVDGNGKVNTTDARLILQHAARRIDAFPAEKGA